MSYPDHAVNYQSNQQGDLLIVDDLADNLRVLSNTLSRRGYRVRAVKNGTMALVGARAVPPDVILLDIRMPEMDGYEVCQQLKADPQLCDIPIIFLSALDEVDDKVRAFEIGGADYITKPFQAEEVLARVNNQITIQRLKKQLAAQKQQWEQMITAAPGFPPPHANGAVQRQVAEAIDTILDYSDRLRQHADLQPEQYAGLQKIYQSGQILLDLVNNQQERESC